MATFLALPIGTNSDLKTIYNYNCISNVAQAAGLRHCK